MSGTEREIVEPKETKWHDILPRVLSALALIAVSGYALSVQGWVFGLLIWVIGGVSIWEAARMFGAPDAWRSGILAAAALALAWVLPPLLVVPLLAAAVIVAALQVARSKVIFVLFAAFILIGSHFMASLVERTGIVWMIWLICIVMMSDIAGYFAGRMLGGPKFWPKISPKKTWSGTLAGWIGAAVLGLGFAIFTGAGLWLVPFSVLVCFAAQMGDIAESGVKRYAGVKDSSNLIPGHGGVLDRFDGMLGAALFAWGAALLGWLPGVA